MLMENPKLVYDSETLVLSSQIGFGEMGTQKITVSDHEDGFVDKNMNSECFVVDIDYLSFGSERDTSANTRSTNVQRNLSRKGTQRGKANQAHQKDAHSNGVTSVAGSIGGGGVDGELDDDHSPKKVGSLFVGAGGCASDKPSIIVVGGGGGSTKENMMSSNNINNAKTVKETVTVTTESRPWKRSNSLKQRSSTSWLMDPRRIVLLFATLSSMGTIILIYFTLSMTKLNGDDPSLIHAQ